MKQPIFHDDADEAERIEAQLAIEEKKQEAAARREAKDGAQLEALSALAAAATWDGYAYRFPLEVLLSRCLPPAGGYLVVTLGSDGDEWIAIRADKLRAIRDLKRPTLHARIDSNGLHVRDSAKPSLRLTIYGAQHTKEYDRAAARGALFFTDFTNARKAQSA
jgi:hypothetical protein